MISHYWYRTETKERKISGCFFLKTMRTRNGEPPRRTIEFIEGNRCSGPQGRRNHLILWGRILIPSVRSRIVSPQPPDGITVDIHPPFLRSPVELPDRLTEKQPVKGRAINITVAVVVVLHAYQHFLPPGWFWKRAPKNSIAKESLLYRGCCINQA